MDRILLHENKIILLIPLILSISMKFHISAVSGQKNGQSDRERDYDVIRLATKPPRACRNPFFVSSRLSGKAIKLIEVSYKIENLKTNYPSISISILIFMTNFSVLNLGHWQFLKLYGLNIIYGKKPERRFFSFASNHRTATEAGAALGSEILMPDSEIRSFLSIDGPLLRSLFNRIVGLNIALEPRYCGGLVNSLHVLDILNHEFFDGTLCTNSCKWNKPANKANTADAKSRAAD